MNPAYLTQTTLAVDDEPFVLKVLARQLRNLGLPKVVTMESASDALALIRSGVEPIGLVCCDLQMPEMDGVEFVRHLAATDYKGALLLVSGEDARILHTAERLARDRGLRVLGALQKPVSPDQLRRLLEVEPTQPRAAAATLSKAYGADEVSRAIHHGELINHYQPRVDMAQGRLCGVETLVRWQHPTDGLVYPDRFVGVAETHGLINDLTRVVMSGLTGALRQARIWQDQGLVIPVAVNVSVDNLMSHDFPDQVMDEIRRAGVPASRLDLEVTESRLMQDPLATIDILTRMRLRRIRLAIDDFGTGHSSLSQLRDIPFQQLKIDRSFVHGAWQQPPLAAMVTSVIDMARHLGMTTVAEGIEDADDWRFLRDAGCDEAQGWYVARPMPGSAVAGWLAQWEVRRRELGLSAAPTIV